MEPERGGGGGEALGEWGGGGREGEGGSVAFTVPCAHHKERGVGCLVSAAGFCFVFVFCCRFFFYFLHGFYFENAITTTAVTIIVNITAASTIISDQNRKQSCYAWRTVQHLNNHPRSR